MGNFVELENKYHLIFNFNDPEKAIAKAVELIQKPGLKNEWKQKRDNLLADKIDTTQVFSFFHWKLSGEPEKNTGCAQKFEKCWQLYHPAR